MSEQTQSETALQSLAEKLRTDAIAIFGEGQEERDIIEWFYAALLAAAPATPAAQGAVPDGYALVPVEPTPAMRVIGARDCSALIQPDQAGEVWRAMIGAVVVPAEYAFAAAPAHPAELQEQEEVQRLRVHVCKLGRYGAAFDPASTHYAYTYTDQPDNLGAGKLGRAALGINPGGDLIDAGLSLLDRLSREGFGVFQIAAGTGQEVVK